jgi:uncharacterized protein YhaN
VSSLVFRRIRIDRLLGISDGFEIRDLASGVNIVYGPNASGKTTTARAFESLLWPRVAAPPGSVIDATAELAGDRWGIRLDSGRVDYQRNGLPADALPTAPPEGRDRYRLWLPDLLLADDADFARRILIESSGGFDLREAARVLEPKRPLHRQRKEQAEIRHARDQVRSAHAAEIALRAEAETFASKEARLSRRAELEKRQRDCSLVLELTEWRARVERSREALTALPSILSRLRGDEAETLEELRKRISDATGRRSSAEVLRVQADRELRRVAVPEPILTGDLLQRLDADVDCLVGIDRDIAEQERRREAAAVRLAEEETPLGEVLDRSRLAAIDLRGLGDLGAAAAAAEEINESRRAFEAQLRSLPEDAPPRELERLQTGALILKQWLASAPGDANLERLRLISLVATALIALAGIAFLVLGAYLLAALGLSVAAGVAASVLRVPPPTDARGEREREFLRIGLLEAPDLWEVQPVASCLGALEERIARGRELDRSWQQRQQLTARLDDLARRADSVDDALFTVAEQLGLRLPNDTVRLLWVVDRIGRWQKARTEQLAAEAALVTAFGTRQAVLESANERLQGIDLSPVTDSRALKGTVEKLRQDFTAHERCSRKLREAIADVLREDAEIERLQGEADRILQRLKIGSDEEHRLTDWCGSVEEYRAQTLSAEVAAGHLRQIEERIASLCDFDSTLLSKPPQDLIAERALVERELSALNTLAEEVGNLRGRIDSAKKGHSVEDALAEEAIRLDALRAVRERELRAAVAAVLVDFVERKTQREHQPQVYRRANEIFGLVTRHAYELRVHDANSGSFLAYDTRAERSFALDELSSGTRVQLLLAVRLAFVDSLEAGVALPLLMDETLANSDDERAAAIMDAVIQLAANGRQVFYFTAQPDEVAKWRRALVENAGVEWSQIDLGSVRSLESRLDPAALEEASDQEPQPELPADVSHPEIPALLSVPTIDLFSPIGSLHLWYLVEDIDLLRQLLSDLRIWSWGGLRSFLDSGADGVFQPQAIQKVETAAKLAATTLSALRRGRGRSVDRGALIASGAISDLFLDRIDELCRDLDGDAGRIIERLESRAVSRFQTRNIVLLRDYLEEEGYLDTRPRRTIDEVRHRIIAENATCHAGGRLNIADLDRLLSRLARGAGLQFELFPYRETPQAQLWPELEA